MALSVEELKQKERERELKTKELRRELEGQIVEQLPENAFEGRKTAVEHYEEIKEVDFSAMKQIIEALLFVASKPLMLGEIRKVVRGYKPSEIEQALSELRQSYEERGASFRLQEVAGGYELSTRPEFAPWILKLEMEKKARAATHAALETLAILAYKQPVTRVEIEEVRGVDSSGVLSSLMDRNLVKITGRKEVPGRPLLYATTDKFLEHFGLKSIEDLPRIDEIKDLVARMINQEELSGHKEARAQNQAGEPAEEKQEEVIPGAEERRQVLEEISEVIKNAKVSIAPEVQNPINPTGIA
ncbi:MAG: SMC-Scp complex subunit ScpB [Candidatus Omnitrophica bacterium]|nr:SMC-Scp complex subunit ScpB [Candidatus Omnitrophota bacterium]